MTRPLRVLFVTAEVAPFSKTGGLGDVGGSLPKALRSLGHDVRVVSPAYGIVEAALRERRWGLEAMPGSLKVAMGTGAVDAAVLRASLPSSDVPAYFVAQRDLFGGRFEVFGYDDDPYRFAFFSRAALELTLGLDWRPDVVHAHDWHAAPAIAWLAVTGPWDFRFRQVATIFTIHNLAHQGRASSRLLDYLGVLTHPLHEEGPGEVNFMARGIHHATLVNTVSPTYAREILTPAGGHGLHGLLQHRHYDVHGILNGLDDHAWDPASDSRLAARFDASKTAARVENKRAVQARAGLPQRADVPLVAMVTRLDTQKGLDITGHVVHRLLNGAAGEAQFVVLGTGARRYEEMFAHICGYHRDKAAAFLSYSADLAPLIYGGSDLFLMPSLFEPCGLGQMIAMRYGSVPVVRATGGLADTVHERVTGFTFHDYDADAFWAALERALLVYQTDRPRWSEIQKRGMQQDFSWEKSARGYVQLYEWALSRVHAGA